MKKVKITKEGIALCIIVLISAVLNFFNLSIEGYGNAYYASAVKSMTMSLKNFFFVSFDPAGFVTIDKPPVGFWLQAISAKIFGFSGVSILLPSAAAGVISVILIYKIVKRQFGSISALLSALFLSITPIFVAVSRNNTIDNILIMFLLLALWALTIAAEKGKIKYLIISLALVGVGFNVKMVEAYLVIPAIYITYLLTTAVSIKKRLIHLVCGTLVLVVVSLSWAFIVDLVPASSRPYVDSSTNNTVMELILGHNGTERLSFGSQGSNGGPGVGRHMSGTSSKNGNMPGVPSSKNGNRSGNPPSASNTGMHGGPINQGGPGGNMQGGFNGQSSNSSKFQTAMFGGTVTAGLTRLFLGNTLADQVVWFIPLAIFGFIASVLKEKLRLSLDNKKKQAIVMWFMWFLPEFIYFSFNTGTWHPYYLTMFAPPTAALAGIGITSLWEIYKEGGFKAYLLPAALLISGASQIIMLSYFMTSLDIAKVLMILVIILNILPAVALVIFNITGKTIGDLKNIKRNAVSLALVGIIITPLVGSGAVLINKVNNSMPVAGLELLSSNSKSKIGGGMGVMPDKENSSNLKLINFLKENKTTSQKYLLVVENSNSASEIIVSTGESVMSLGGFLGSDKILTLAQFKGMVKKGEIRYVMTGGMGGNSSSEIMNWVKSVGKKVSTREYSNQSTKSSTANKTLDNNTSKSDSKNRSFGMGMNQEQLYDLKAYTDSSKDK
ncbi:4-amino-4-deoxy-L-arabinose transferase-like glycosyltransferase [Clostridium acetobutylicum]|uniref:Uncharacterized conserved membrane protein, affecting LPS biosynthesis n=1 Tax=Clostridium acetobutylicum (strain ATCC 824 / DSM 792 / JCM 1419 / IAM 19013 / LMG 5710 / NBRC 13948 / NRRL B-527 / VKM B-1787 / 2291 / W) TaxID=272562 RepID=Q97GW4_CLOAB|nr:MULTISPECIES: glycosyltransferase family 39 protein [Clostridium]AAK80208.1 Uncharacterized conserved membrane protein, affecting LPS biosynthesis [Clostridium acetobutylicum ATCC 824]ADZ21302.1 Conserved hypothetical protein [Clostridium acetobutylicum EA 2018]AEI33380.1 hypothetical protein SMB_G2284 [Clostridium acetobutylicum DSM 1731]AWV79367.1 glycosyltransferase family 39 protein [Clostridium acetobutylicum]MBC2394662.1 glycosyltransferase family 39 protein [Clostridium acetobutylicu